MSSRAKLRRSRAQWKAKATARGHRERYLRKENRRLQHERDRYRRDARATRKQVEDERHQERPLMTGKEELVYVALRLFLVARISFRAVSRVLGVLCQALGLVKVPCAQTIIHWVTRLSLARLRNAELASGSARAGERLAKGRIWLIDVSIGLGAGKILAVLALKANHHEHHPGAPTLEQVNCVAVAVADAWNGETMADFLATVIARTGRPVAYLKDGATDLGKATRLLGERGVGSVCIADVSHTVANLLKHEYQDHPLLERFLKCCGTASTRLKQSILACLAPPKVSTKARFMNLHRLVHWAEQVLEHVPQGGAPAGSALAKLRTSLNQLPDCKTFIAHFQRDAKALLQCQHLLKTKGLSPGTYRQCQAWIEPIPLSSAVRTGFTRWAEEHLQVAADSGLAHPGLPISSDTIESLFGVAKRHGTGEVKDADRIALRIPALCGVLTKDDARRVLAVSVQEQQQVLGALPSLLKQRRQVLPNPGSLETLQSPTDTKKHVELMPGSEKRSNNLINITILNSYDETIGPSKDARKPAKPPPEVAILEAVAG